MFKKILLPVDLAHIERIERAMTAAADLAKHYRISLCVVGVTAETPTAIAHTPDEFAQKLRQFGTELAQKHRLSVETAAYPSHDPVVDLDKVLIAAAKDNGADLIVMASHVPGFAEHVLASNAGAVASHAEVSVFVVR